jgi:hypothetical protein
MSVQALPIYDYIYDNSVNLYFPLVYLPYDPGKKGRKAPFYQRFPSFYSELILTRFPI